MVWGGRWEEGSGWGTHVYLWRIHFDIWQNQYNIVKLINKIKLIKKKRVLEWCAIAFSERNASYALVFIIAKSFPENDGGMVLS